MKALLTTLFLLALTFSLEAQETAVSITANQLPYTLASAEAAQGGSGVQYKWYKNGVEIASSNAATYTIASQDLDIPTTYTRAARCAECTDWLYSNPITVVVACPYAGADLVIGSCKKRTAGNLNWEAKILDSRDGNVYGIVQVGNMWVMAQDLLYAYTSRAVYGTEPLHAIYAGASVLPTRSAVDAAAGQQSICPAGWHLPSTDEWINLANCASGTCSTTRWTGSRYTQLSLFIPNCDYAIVSYASDATCKAACNNAWGANFWVSWTASWVHYWPLIDGPLTNGWMPYIANYSLVSTTGSNAYTWAGTSHNAGNPSTVYIRCVR